SSKRDWSSDVCSSDLSDSANIAPAAGTAPVAKKIPFERTHHGHTFIDDYEWMREKESPEVISHLEAENAWTKSQTAHLDRLQESIFTEIKTRIKETDMSEIGRASCRERGEVSGGGV